MVFFLPLHPGRGGDRSDLKFLYDGQYGAVALIWGWFGAQAPFVLADRGWAMAVVLLLVVWKYFGFHMMLYIAGCRTSRMRSSTPPGSTAPRPGRSCAGSRSRCFSRPSACRFLLGGRGAAAGSTLVMALTRGGPSNATHSLVTYLSASAHADGGRLRQRRRRGLFLICVTLLDRVSPHPEAGD